MLQESLFKPFLGADAKWLTGVLFGESIAQSIFVLSLVATAGLALGSLKLRGLSLGIAGVLFAGLFAGHCGLRINTEVMHFVRELGLILFVYTIGMQVGPGFLASLKQQGLAFNVLAAAVVALGTGMAAGLVLWSGVDLAAAVGLLCGATTNTPSLGAGQQALAGLSRPETSLVTPGLAYAVSYPFGIIGIIITMLLVRGLLRIHLPTEESSLREAKRALAPRLATINLVVRNPNLEGQTVSKIPGLAASGVVISRLLRGEDLRIATPDTVLALGDALLAVGPRERLDELRIAVGEETERDLKAVSSPLTVRRIVVTKKATVGKTLGDMSFEESNHVRVTRLSRAELELANPCDRRLQIGDTLTVVGAASDVERAAAILGNSMRDLDHPEIIPLFLGIAAGVLLGTLPIQIPGVPSELRLGLAGGPLIVAIVLSRIGKMGPLLWYIPTNANFLLREFGIVLFLAAVGLNSGGAFVRTLTEGDGLLWMGYGAVITLAPLLLAGFVGRVAMKMNYLSLCGVLAGSMTDPPALAFANKLADSDAPSVSYATVYPLTMLLRVLAAQLFVLFLGGR